VRIATTEEIDLWMIDHWMIGLTCGFAICPVSRATKLTLQAVLTTFNYAFLRV
jgi:hypothetical protein